MELNLVAWQEENTGSVVHEPSGLEPESLDRAAKKLEPEVEMWEEVEETRVEDGNYEADTEGDGELP